VRFLSFGKKNSPHWLQLYCQLSLYS
jgi:hypothetical protein